MIIDSINQRAFVHVPKCGGTTLRDFFHQKKGFKVITEAHESVNYYSNELKKYGVKEFICFLRYPTDWFLSYFTHSALHNINSNHVGRGFHFFVKNYYNIYKEMIERQCPKNTKFYDLNSMDNVMFELGYGNIGKRKNVSLGEKSMTQQNHNIISNNYNLGHWSSYNSKVKIKKEEVNNCMSTKEVKIMVYNRPKNSHFRIKK